MAYFRCEKSTKIIKNLLWNNPSPTTQFPAQTLSLDLSKYDAVIIRCSMNTTQNTDFQKPYQIFNFVPKDGVEHTISTIISTDGTSNGLWSRKVTVTDAGITFSIAGYPASTLATGSNAGYVIPTEIYGYVYEPDMGRMSIEPLIPVMTSNTTPSGVVSADSVYNSAGLAYKAVDGVATTSDFDAWVSAVGPPHWWQYEFETPVRVLCMYISGRKYMGDANGQIQSFILKASNDGENWVSLTDTISRSGVGLGVRTYHIINSNSYYLYYRISDISNNIAGIGELQFFGFSR